MDEFGEWVILCPEKDSKQLENVYNWNNETIFWYSYCNIFK